MGSFWQPRNQPGSKDRIHWNLMLEWVDPPIASRRLPSKQRHTPPSSRAPVPPGRELEVLSIFSHRNSTHKQAPSMLISLRAAISACRSVRVLGSCRCWPGPAATPARRRWRVPSLRLAVINFLLRTATFRHLNGHRRD